MSEMAARVAKAIFAELERQADDHAGSRNGFISDAPPERTTLDGAFDLTKVAEAAITAIGEPTAIICFDPREAAQILDEPSTWKPTDNVALIAASFVPVNERPPEFWERVKAQADYCEELVPFPA